MSTLQDVVSKISPALGAILGTFVPGGSLIVSGLASLFGVTSTNQDDIAKSIQADPDAAVKIKQFEYEHQDALIEAQTKIRLGAYQREAEVVKATGHRDWVIDFLAIGTVSGFFLLSALIFFVKVDPSMAGIVNFVCGEISTASMMVLAYYFGATFKAGASIPPMQNVVLPPPAQTR